MAALDTNVLVRYLLEDDANQLAAAERLVRRSVNRGESLFVPVTVALELEWVLRSSFAFDKLTVIQTFFEIMAWDELKFDAEDELETALETYRTTSADYADCLHAALTKAADLAPLWTFDKAAAKLDGAKLLTSIC